MRSRLALLLLPLALVFYLVRPRTPDTVPLRLHLGPRSAEVREVGLKFERDEAVARDVTLLFAAGAPADVERSVRLADGDYQVGVRVVYEGRPEDHFTRRLHADREAAVDLDLSR